MANAESIRESSSETSWDDLTRTPEVGESVAEDQEELSVKDAEYYINNPSEISSLASKYIESRGGIEAADYGTWDAALRTKVDERGLPTRWSDLARFLRKNPDAIQTVIDQLSTNPDEVEVETEEGDSTDDIQEMAPEEASSFAGGDIVDISNLPTEERIKFIDGRIDSITDFPALSSTWNEMSKTLDGCNKGVISQVKYLRAKEALELSKVFLKEQQSKLRDYNFVLPWSKRAQELRVIRDTIESSKTSIRFQESQLNLMRTMLPDALSEEDKKLVAGFRSLDERMARMNDDLHTRELLKEIRMREKWIRDQEKFMDDQEENDSKPTNAPSNDERIVAIANWKQEIADLQERIRLYQAMHPDFVLEPGKTALSASERKIAA